MERDREREKLWKNNFALFYKEHNVTRCTNVREPVTYVNCEDLRYNLKTL